MSAARATTPARADGEALRGARIQRLALRLEAWSPRRQDLLAGALYAAVWIVFIGRRAVVDPAHSCACDGKVDSTIFMWSLAWWPHALLHGLNPFVARVIWVPHGLDIPATTSVPTLAIVLSPLTELFGPFVSYNAAAFLCPVLGGLFAFRLCRYVSRAWLPSLLGGYVFAFSSYELGQLAGHLHMVAVFLLPATLHLVLLWFDRRVSDRRFVVLMTIIIVLQVGLSTEVLLTMAMFGAVAGMMAWILSVADERARISALARRIVFAGIAAGALVSPFLYYAIRGLHSNGSIDWVQGNRTMSADPLNYVLPTPVSWFGHGWVSSLAAKFIYVNGGPHYSEAGAYIGLPLLAILIAYAVSTHRRVSTRVLFGTMAVAVVCSFGARLHLAPFVSRTSPLGPRLPMPWVLFSRLPVFNHLLPVRFALYAFLVAALVATLWLARPDGGPGRWLLAAAAILFLLPNPNQPSWSRHAPATPPLFTSDRYRRYLKPGEIVLALPYGYRGSSMLWQARTGMYFSMAGGYLAPDIPDDYFPRDSRLLTNFYSLQATGLVPPDLLGPALRDFIARRHVQSVIVDGTTPNAWPTVLAGLGVPANRAGGVLLYAGRSFTDPPVPRIDSLQPADRADAVPPRSPLIIGFATPMDPASTATAFSLASLPGGQPVPGRTVQLGAKTLVFLPAHSLAPGGRYAARIAGTATSRLGIPLGTSRTWRFTAR